jgi:hypothetical protein
MLCSLTVGLCALTAAPEMVAEARGARYARIRVSGHADTPDRIILKQLGGITPGAKVSAADVRALRKRLAALGAFRTAPNVMLIVNELDDTLIDLWIHVEERPGNWFTFGLWSLCDHGIEAVKNFDRRPFLDEWAWFRYRWREAPPR